MHILIGGLVGGAFALVTVAAAAVIMGRRPTLKNAGLAILGGVVAGAITSATLGASSLVGVTATRQVVAFAAGGAAGGAAEQLADNALSARPLQQGVARASGTGAATGLISLGFVKGSHRVLAKVAPGLLARMGSAGRAVRGAAGSGGGAVGAATAPATGAGGTFASRVLSAPAPGTGGSWVRSFGDGGLHLPLGVDMGDTRERRQGPAGADAQAEPTTEQAEPTDPIEEADARQRTRRSAGLIGALRR